MCVPKREKKVWAARKALDWFAVLRGLDDGMGHPFL